MTKNGYRNLVLWFYLIFLIFYIIAIMARFFIFLTIYNTGVNEIPYNFYVINLTFSFFGYFVFVFLLWMLIWSANNKMITTKNLLNLLIWIFFIVFVSLLFFELFIDSVVLSTSIGVLLIFWFTFIVLKFVQEFKKNKILNILLLTFLILYFLTKLFVFFLPLIGVPLLTLIYSPFMWLIFIIFLFLLVLKAVKHYK